MNDRSIQWKKACGLVNDDENPAIPHYDFKKFVWIMGEGEHRQEDIYLDRIIQDFVGVEMQFRYHWNGTVVTRQIFAEILEDMLTRYEELCIEGFEVVYSPQQRKWLGIIRDKLRETKGRKGTLE